ncbi:LOW QUALITY PROTEIN: hypothetical protein QC762_0016160 [Podospora pseudocomata]|uniref:Uncharacterized protein n=1 Tax=Podospora pseudocomata TaxID=2093779 RepID=A0ABR0GWY6_9PEZI|nr:LOW QUALITY PROTEIN: hypothetical protein QC762_0016160 [Podospora pseudocomata]
MLKIAMKRKRDKSRSDFHRYPPRLSAQRQDLKKSGYRSSPLSVQLQRKATAATQIESKRLLTVGHRGYRSSTRVGSVAPLGNTKEDDYYRNDSLKYCRHEEKKKKKTEILADRSRIYTGGGVASARLQIL